MKAKQILLASSFVIGCLAFGYFGSQKLGATTTSLIGIGMISAGAIAHIRRTNSQSPIPNPPGVGARPKRRTRSY